MRFFSAKTKGQETTNYAQSFAWASNVTRRPRLLLVGTFLSREGGVRALCEDLAVALKSSGWSVLTTSNQAGRFTRLLDLVVTVWRHRHRYDVAHVDVFSGLAFVWAELVCWALWMARKPYVLTLRGGNLPTFAKGKEKRVQRLLRGSSIVTVPSTYLFEQMRPYRQDLVLLSNPLDLVKYSFKHRKRPAPNLVWLRSFHNIYNPALAVRVVALLAKQFPDVRLVMIGPDKGDGSFESTKDMAIMLGVQDRVICPGHVTKSEVPHWLDQGNIFLNTARVDNAPVSVLEAMACGLCVVSTNVGGIPYLLQTEHDAVLVPSDDHVAMGKAVQRILTEDGLAERLSANARRKSEQLDWSNILPRWERLLTDAAQICTT
jgi:glycosyltransferase involved in cell wall biosynthesis